MKWKPNGYTVNIDYANGENYPIWTLMKDNLIVGHWHKKPTKKQMAKKIKEMLRGK